MLFYTLLALAANAPETNVEKPVVSKPTVVQRPANIPVAPSSPERRDPKPRGNPGNWATTNDYPSEALQKELEGTTGFRLTVGPDGRVADCLIVSSSGSPVLDSATCANVTRRARFEPALDATGAPTTGQYSNRIRWQIPRLFPLVTFPRGPVSMSNGWMRVVPADFPPQALAEKRQGLVKIELAISSAGGINGCKVLASSGHADIDAQTCKIGSERALFSPALDVGGQPTPGRVQTELTWRIPGPDALPVVPLGAVMPQRLLPQEGMADVSFTVTADGTLADCTAKSTVKNAIPIGPESLCKLKMNFEPYTDAANQPVARRVTIKTIVNVEDVK